MSRVGRWVAVLAALLALGEASARAATGAGLALAPPHLLAQSGEVELLLAPVRSDGRAARLARLSVDIDGAVVPARFAPLFAAPGARVGAGPPGRSSSGPAVAVGLVYAWGEGAPQEILEGVPRLLRPLPGEIAVHPVPYGEGLPAFVTPRTAADLRGGDLDLVAPIPGRRPVLARAIEFGARQLLLDRPALPFLFVITDGQDHEQREPEAFFQLGRQLRARGLLLTVVWFPGTGDQVSGRHNAGKLAAGAQGRLLAAPTRAELADYLEGAGLTFLDAGVVTLRPGRRLSGAMARLEVRAEIAGGLEDGEGAAPVAASARVWLPGSSGVWLGGAGVTLGLALLVAWRARADRGAQLTETTDEPSGSFSAADPASGSFNGPVSETPPEAEPPPAPADIHARTAAALAALAGLPIEGALVALRDRLGDEPLRGLAAWSFAETAAFLRRAEPLHPGLGTRQGRQWLLALQDALAQDGATPAVAWLVRAGGPGPRGETLPLGPSTPLPGGAAIVARGRGFLLVDRDGQRPLRDGEVLSAGRDRYVFKSVP